MNLSDLKIFSKVIFSEGNQWQNFQNKSPKRYISSSTRPKTSKLGKVVTWYGELLPFTKLHAPLIM